MMGRFIAMVVSLCMTVAAGAQSFVQNDIGYEVIDDGAVAVVSAPAYGRVKIPATVRCDGHRYDVTTVCSGVFTACPNLYEVHLPATVTTLGDRVMSSCPNLKTVSCDGRLTDVGFSVLQGTAWMDAMPGIMPMLGGCILACRDSIRGALTLPVGTVSVANGVFTGQKHITGLTLASTTVSIGEKGFANCYGIKEINGLSRLRHVGDCAFFGTAWYDALPEGVTYVGDALVRVVGNRDYIAMPEGIKRIDSYAMQIHPGYYVIGSRDFYQIGEIFLPASLREVGENALVSYDVVVYSLAENVDMHNNQAMEQAVVHVKRTGDYIYRREAMPKREWLPDSLYALVRYIGHDDQTVLPATVEGEEYAILDRWLYKYSTPTSVVFKNSQAHLLNGVTMMKGASVDLDGVLSLEANWALTSEITMPASLKHLSYDAFAYAHDIQTVNWNAADCQIYYPSGQNTLPDWGATAVGIFYSCRTLNVGGNVTSLPANICSRNANLTEVNLPVGLKEIGDHAFYVCRGLQNIDLPDGIEHIGRAALDYCTALSDLVMPEGVDTVTIGGCTGLKKLTMPSTAKDVNLYGCSHLSELVMLPATPPTGVIDNIPAYACRLYAPDGSEAAYRQTSPWNQFQYDHNNIRPQADGINRVLADGDGLLYELSGRRADGNSRGVLIMRQNGRSLKLIKK